MKRFSFIMAILMLFTFGCTAVEEKIDTKQEQEQEQEQVNESSPTVNSVKEEEKAAVEVKQVQAAGDEMSVHFIDVGQGDSILIQSPEGKSMLIDGGKKDADNKVLTYLQNLGIDKLDYIVATHPDSDHIGGLISVLTSVSVKNFVDSGKVHTSQTYEQMLQLILNKELNYIVPSKGDTIPLDSNLEITVLNDGIDSTDNNEASLVLKVQYLGISFLLTGDAGVGVEQSLLNEFNLESTILKAGHHGSDTSSSQAFIQSVKPKVAILSYGVDNSYGHPSLDVVNRLKAAGSQVFSTAEVGDIIVKTNGVDYTVSAEQELPEESKSKSESVIEPTIKVTKSSVAITSIDLREEIVEITNNGETPTSLQGWKLVSVIGDQVFTFPDVTLAAGKTIYITSGPNATEGQDDIKWNNGQMWKNDGDAAQLLNEKGEVVSEFK